MPYIYVKLAFNEKLPHIDKKINSLDEGIAWVRGMDIEPILTDMSTIEKAESELEQRRKDL